jgi:ADP-ribose pyrophosphatase
MNISNLKKLTDERWVNLYAVDFEHKGHHGRWVFASRKEKPYAGISSDAVLIVATLRNPGEPPRLVLVREFRVPVGCYVYGMPAGLVEPGESVEETVRREVREETGLELSAVHRISPPLLSSCGLTDEAVAMAFVDVQGPPEAAQHLEGGEDIEVVLLDYEGVCRLCDDPSAAFDAKTWNVLYLYQKLGKLE